MAKTDHLRGLWGQKLRRDDVNERGDLVAWILAQVSEHPRSTATELMGYGFPASRGSLDGLLVTLATCDRICRETEPRPGQGIGSGSTQGVFVYWIPIPEEG